MPNHWESSGRPLFVKTVYVNGSRHAILSQEDPLLHPSQSSTSRKQSRPNSSLSEVSTLSENSLESPDSNPRLSKDLSAELQSCLVKLRFASASRQEDKKTFSSSQEDSSYETVRHQKRFIKQRRKKWTRNKGHKEKRNPDSSGRNNVSGGQTGGHDCFLTCKIGNDKTTKNYCFLKFSTDESSFVLNGNCGKNWCNFRDFISSSGDGGATDGSQNGTSHSILDHSRSVGDKPRVKGSTYPCGTHSDPCELYWNNYLARSLNSSLTERVIQWIDLAKRQKKFQDTVRFRSKEDSPSEERSERIFSGKTFVSCEGTQMKVRDSGVAKDTDQTGDDASTEMKNGDDVQSTVRNVNVDNSDDPDVNSKGAETDITSIMSSIASKFNSNSTTAIHLKNSIESRLQIAVPRATPQHSLEDIVKNNKWFTQSKKSCRDQQNCHLQHGKSFTDRSSVDGDEGNNHGRVESLRITRAEGSDWTQYDSSRRISNQTNSIKLEGDRYYMDFIKPETECRNWTMGELEDNENPDANPSAGDVSTSWQFGKGLGKPQLHIFMPAVPGTKETSEGSISECDSFLSEL